MTKADAINGLKHMADDHPCCREFIDAVILMLSQTETNTSGA